MTEQVRIGSTPLVAGHAVVQAPARPAYRGPSEVRRTSARGRGAILRSAMAAPRS